MKDPNDFMLSSIPRTALGTANARISQLEAERSEHTELMRQATDQINSFYVEVPRLMDRIEQLESELECADGAIPALKVANERIGQLDAALRKIADMHPERWHNIGCGIAMKRIATAVLGNDANGVAEAQSLLDLRVSPEEEAANIAREEAAIARGRSARETPANPDPKQHECPVCRRPIDGDDIYGSCANTKDGSHRRIIRETKDEPR